MHEIFANLTPPSAEHVEARMRAWREDLERRSSGDYFNPVNLGHWIELCQAARVPHVPAEEIARIPVQEVTCFDMDPCPPSVAPFFDAVRDAMTSRPNHMVRWACCTCDPVKYHLSKGEPEFREEFARLYIDDFRAYEIVSEFPELTIAAYARPWVKARVHDRWPVEYRVFVDHGHIFAVSNYYPQRPLPNDAASLNDIGVCLLLAVNLIAAQKKPMNYPPIEKRWDITKLSCSMDFISLEDGQVLFLEGGPPYSRQGGSHPCCFAGRDPDGIAFEATAEGLASLGLVEQEPESA